MLNGVMLSEEVTARQMEIVLEWTEASIHQFCYVLFRKMYGARQPPELDDAITAVFNGFTPLEDDTLSG